MGPGISVFLKHIKGFQCEAKVKEIGAKTGSQLAWALGSPGGLADTKTVGSTPRVSGSVGLGGA